MTDYFLHLVEANDWLEWTYIIEEPKVQLENLEMCL